MAKRNYLSFCLIVALFLVLLVSCSLFKSKPKAATAPGKTSTQNLVVSGSPQDVKKHMGEPSSVEKTPDGRVLWIYKPSWKIMPDDRGDTYVEFENGKVSRVFKKE
jgi:hypothetical protein